MKRPIFTAQLAGCVELQDLPYKDLGKSVLWCVVTSNLVGNGESRLWYLSPLPHIGDSTSEVHSCILKGPIQGHSLSGERGWAWVDERMCVIMLASYATRCYISYCLCPLGDPKLPSYMSQRIRRSPVKTVFMSLTYD